MCFYLGDLLNLFYLLKAETLANCVDQLKSEIQCRDEKVRCLEQERDSLSCLNMELCEKNLQLEGTIAEWKEDVNGCY